MKKLITILFAVALGLNLNAQDECLNPDVNCDGYVNVYDLLGLLGYFGDEDLDGDGIWDSQDDCVEDECGICDGPGPQVLAVDTITFTTDSTFIEAISEWCVFAIPDTTFTFVCTNPGCIDPMAENYDPYASEDDGSCVGVDPCSNELTVTFDGYTYDLVAIGDQCWFAENLRNEHYANGDVIPGELSNGEWSDADDTNLGAQAIYNNDASNLTDYGRLYNWFAVDDARGLCPSGWHVPTDGEYMTLEMALGMSESEANGTGYRGTDQGTQMKSSASDSPSWDGTNTSGFSGLAGGYRNYGGDFYNEGYAGYFWSASAYGTYAWYRRLDGGYTEVGRYDGSQRFGFRVRCVRD